MRLISVIGRSPIKNIVAALLATALVSAAGAAILNAAFPDWRFIHYPLHASVESLGAFAAFIVALLILGMRNHGHLGASYTWVASALIGMGFLDGLHALHHAGTEFVWLHSIATCVGGVVFVGVWFADRLTHFWIVRHTPKAVLILSFAIGIGSLVFPQSIPDMVVDGQFSFWARVTNILGGVGFLIASLYFLTADNQREDQKNRMVFSSHCFLFGISGVIFEFSVIWDAAWWFWHVLRICAYMIAISFYFNMARAIERELHVLRRNLEIAVEEKTETLKEEMYLRQEAQATVRKIGMAIEQSPIIVFITDTNGIIEYVNQRFEDVTGYTRVEAIGQTPKIIKSPDTSVDVHESLWETILSGKTWVGELKDKAKNGTEFWASVTISPIRNQDNVITNFVAMHEDITIRKQENGRASSRERV